MIRASAMLLRHIGHPQLASKIDMALELCGQFEKKLVLTGRDNGATGEEYTQYLLSWVDRSDLQSRWEEEVHKLV